MMRPLMQSMIWALVAVGIAVAAAPPFALAQMGGASNQPSAPTGPVDTNAMENELHLLTDVQAQRMDQKERSAYEAFYKENQEPAKKIELGKAFLQKYPKSVLAEAVDAGLVNAYIAQHDWSDLYATADNALALKPDDVDVLTTVGWVIPHEYHPDDPGADTLLGKAETYERHALDVMTTMPKPSHISDAQFAALKTQKTLQAHSALGLVYFRRDDYDASAKELQQATKDNPSADQTDLYVLGIDQQNLKRYADAEDAYNRCAQISGGLADRCKQGADGARKLAALK